MEWNLIDPGVWPGQLSWEGDFGEFWGIAEGEVELLGFPKLGMSQERVSAECEELEPLPDPITPLPLSPLSDC